MVCETDSAMVKAIPECVRTMALRIIRDEPQLWPIFVKQFRQTNPTEADQLQRLLDLATSHGTEYLIALCRKTESERETANVR